MRILQPLIPHDLDGQLRAALLPAPRIQNLALSRAREEARRKKYQSD